MIRRAIRVKSCHPVPTKAERRSMWDGGLKTSPLICFHPECSAREVTLSTSSYHITSRSTINNNKKIQKLDLFLCIFEYLFSRLWLRWGKQGRQGKRPSWKRWRLRTYFHHVILQKTNKNTLLLLTNGSDFQRNHTPNICQISPQRAWLSPSNAQSK